MASIYIQNQLAVFLTTPSSHNGANANQPGGMVVAPSQTKVIVKKAFPLSTKGGGMASALGPDVCKVPSPAGPVPTPFPNMAQLAMATKESTKVFALNKGVLKADSEIPRTQGDEAGVAGGVVSSTFGDKATFKPTP